MVELFVYDASEVNRDGYTFLNPGPVVGGIRNALLSLNPPIPFLIRGRRGDYDLLDNSIRVKNTFWGKSLREVLKDVLYNGTERSEDYKLESADFELEKRLIKNFPLNTKPQDIMWARIERHISLVRPYRYEDDCGGFTEGNTNDLTMIIDPSLYSCDDFSKELFYQLDIKLRRKALLGIIISDTNPNRPRLGPMSFTITSENLDEIFKTLTETGYFTSV